jgi:hypothetical protein
MIDKSKLKELAQKANEETWLADNDGKGAWFVQVRRFASGKLFDVASICEANGFGEMEAKFIAAANPAAILELLAENERLTAAASASLPTTGWKLIDGLLYRLNEKGANCDEISVTMANGSRDNLVRNIAASAILDALTKSGNLATTASTEPADAVHQNVDTLIAAQDAAYPIPDSPHASVVQRAEDNREAYRRGWMDRLKASTEPADQASGVAPPVAAPVGQHEPATVVQGEFGPALHVYGVPIQSWIGVAKWGEFASNLAARINAASGFREGRNAQPKSSPLATPAADVGDPTLPYESLLNGFISIMGVEDSGDIMGDARKAIDKVNALLATKAAPEPAPDGWQFHSALSRCAELLDNMADNDALIDTPIYLKAKLAELAASPAPSAKQEPSEATKAQAKADLMPRREAFIKYAESRGMAEWERGGDEGYKAMLAAAPVPPAAPAEIPAILFDGKAVYDEMQAAAPCKSRTSPENVSDTLDAVVRLMRRAAPAEQQSAQEPSTATGSILTVGQILSLERRSDMTDDEALRYGRAVESLLLSAPTAQQSAQAERAAVEKFAEKVIDEALATGWGMKDDEPFADSVREVIERALHSAPVAPNAEQPHTPSQYGSPELQALIVERAVEQPHMAGAARQGGDGENELRSILSVIAAFGSVSEQNMRQVFAWSDRRVAVARRDAERYRWLRDKSLGFDQVGSISPYVVIGQSMRPVQGAELDSVVDCEIQLGAAIRSTAADSPTNNSQGAQQ